ncbi:hypothetical protein QYF61_010653 [Mycteria americana]|uniref:Uncharacterized protein n=1 Tax=Mycteria americana TaxID=33587 RepID=A0AAN7SG12_MYCAM|nr:hypothetical protein QYF61_010653 [Mycteria americana]
MPGYRMDPEPYCVETRKAECGKSPTVRAHRGTRERAWSEGMHPHGTWLPQAQLVHQLAESTLRPIIQIIDKDFKLGYQPWYQSLRDATSHWLPVEDIDILERVLWMATKIIRGLGHMMDKDTLRDLGLLCLKKGRLNRDFTVLFSCLMGNDREDEVILLSELHSERKRGNSHKLKKGKGQLHTRKKISP